MTIIIPATERQKQILLQVIYVPVTVNKNQGIWKISTRDTQTWNATRVQANNLTYIFVFESVRQQISAPDWLSLCLSR